MLGTGTKDKTAETALSRFRKMAGALCLAAFGTAAVAQAAPDAGTEIVNIAEATYFNTALGIVETVSSNPVSATVAAVPGLEVIGDDINRLPPTGNDVYTWRAINTGNTPFDLNLSIAEQTGDDFDVAGTLYVDANRNGVVDAGDYPIEADTSLPLPAGSEIAFVFAYSVPASVLRSQLSNSTLTVTASSPLLPGTTLTESRDGTTEIVEALVSLGKTAAHRGDSGEIDYTIRAENNGDVAIEPYDEIDGVPLTIDGVQRAAVLIRDAIPENTVFVSVGTPGRFELLYHIDGDAKHSYFSAPPLDPASIDAIAFYSTDQFEAAAIAEVAFTVRLDAGFGSGTILNTAESYARDGGEVVTSFSNETEIVIADDPTAATIFDSDFDTPVGTVALGNDATPIVTAASCNLSDGTDTASIVVTSEIAGDREIVQATETGPASGQFLLQGFTTVEQSPGIAGNDIVEAVDGDRILLTAVCDDPVTPTFTVDPVGFLFDSLTNRPVVGASLRILNPVSGEVFAEAITNAEGFFSLADVPLGQCTISVTPPDSHVFPSGRLAFPGFGRQVLADGSYGLPFDCDADFTSIDVPLDPATYLPLTLEKTADRQQVARGGYVIYRLRAENEMAVGLVNARIEDRLPAGLLYVAGSAKRDGETIADPAGAPGRVLDFSLGTIGGNSGFELEYAVKVGPAAGQGDKINAAAFSGTMAGLAREVASQTARATVRVDDGGTVFAEQASVLGKVFLDRNGNGLQDEAEDVGIPGVKIVTSNGLSVVTDAEGRYSLFGLPPRPQVFAVQRSSLPPGAKLLATEADDMRRAGSRVIDLKKSELRAEDFSVEYTERMAALVAERRGTFQPLDAEESLFRDDLPLTFGSARTDLSSRRETAIDTSTEFDLRGAAPGLKDGSTTRAAEPEAPKRLSREERKAELEQLIGTLTPEFGFVGLDDGFLTRHNSVDVVVKSPAEAGMQLSVNGEPVPGTQIGTKVLARDAGIKLYEYIAVRLQPGENTVSATLTDPFGNSRGEVTRTVYAPGRPATVQLIAPDEIPADSRVRVPVVVRLLDADGRPVPAPAELTLRAERGSWDVEDIRGSKGGVQVYLDNGEATFDFIPPDLVGSVSIYADADFDTGETVLRVSPDLDERVFVGIVEGAIGFGESGERIDGLIETDELSPFEETTEGVRGQLYLKGRILGDSLLTLRYDSDQDTSERLFRDIARDEYYPIYGDSSERGFDAQSSSQLFVKVEREQSFILYGDIAVDPESDAVRLGAYRRSLTGAKGHLEHGPVTLTVFAAQTEQMQRIVEVPARGISGPYDVPLDGALDGSEIVEIVTRDRDQPGIILSKERQTRFTDYSLDFFDGALIFNRPIQQIDDDLNPVSIRVTYETDIDSSDKYWVYGGELRYEPVEGYAIGYREVRSDAERDSTDRRTVRSLYAEADLGAYGELELEAAQTENNLGESGFGYRGSYELQRGETTLRAEAARTDEDFDAPGSYVAAGRDEARLTVEHTLGPRARTSADALYTRDRESGEQRYGAELRATYTVNPQLDLTAGTRAVRTDSNGEQTDVLSGIVGIAYRPAQVQGLALRAEYEQDFAEFNNWRLMLGGDYQYNPNVKFYALNELSTTESGYFGIGDGVDTNFTTRAGAEYRMNEYLSGYSEYRDGGRGPGDGVANGVKAEWKATVSTTLRATAEHVEPVRDGGERSSAVTLGAVYDNAENGVLLRSEIGWNGRPDSNSYYADFAAGYEVNDSLSLLLRNRFAYDDRGEDDRLRDRLRFGIAYRPRENARLRLLGWYEYEIDEDATTEQAHRWSVGATQALTPRMRMKLRYAGKYSEFESGSVRESNTLHMALAGGEIDLIENRLSLAAHGALFTDGALDNLTYGMGAEVKLAVTEQVQLGLGYNYIAVDEDRVRDLYFSGAYARVRMKLDDGVWDALEGDYSGIAGGPHSN